MTTLLPPPQTTGPSSASLLEASVPPLGWRHMPAFGSGFLSYASGCINWPPLPGSATPHSPTLDSFWSSVARGSEN